MKIIPELVVENIENSINFYQTFLDFHLVDKIENEESYLWARMKSKDESVEIMFIKQESVNDEIPEIEDRGVGKMILLIEVDDINYLYSKFEDKRFILKDLYKTDYGTNEFLVKDIDGYILDISER